MTESTYLIYSVLGAHYAVPTSSIGLYDNPEPTQDNSRLVELIERMGNRIVAYQPNGLLLLHQDQNHIDRFQRLKAMGSRKFDHISLFPEEKFCNVFYEK